jgi:hypothetical protein
MRQHWRAAPRGLDQLCSFEFSCVSGYFAFVRIW